MRKRRGFLFFSLLLLFLFNTELYASSKPPLPLPGLVPPEQIAPPRGIKRDPEKALELFKEAVTAFWLGKYDEALKGFDAVIKTDLYALEPYYWKGLIYLRQGLLEEAKRMFEYYLEVKPADLRLIRALESVNRLMLPSLSPPQFLFPKSYSIINPFERTREKEGLLGSLKATFINPVYNVSALALGPDDNLYVADYGRGKVFVFSREGTLLRSWGGLKNPSGIAVSLDGRVYVSDFSESKIYIFDLFGKLLGSFGEGELANPQGLAIDSYGYLYVCDWGNHRLCRYTLNGKFIRSIGEGILWEPLAVCVDDRGDIWVSDGNERCIFRFGWGGLLKGRFLEDVFSRSLTLDLKGRVIVADEERRCLFVIDKDGILEKINLSKAITLSSLVSDTFGNLFLFDFDRLTLYKVETPFSTGKVEIRISKLDIKEGLEREAEIEVSEGWYPLPLEKVGLFARIIDGGWITEPSKLLKTDKPLIIGVVVDPQFADISGEILEYIRLKMLVVDRAFVLGAFNSPKLPPNRWRWEKAKEGFEARASIKEALDLLVQEDRRRVLIYCGKPPALADKEMRRLAYFMRKHQVRFFLLSDSEPDPLWNGLIAYTGGRFWNIFYVSENMPIADLFRKTPFETYLLSYMALSPGGKDNARRSLRVFMEMPLGHYEDEVTYYNYTGMDPEKILR